MNFDSSLEPALDASRGEKPLDFGGDGVCGCVDKNGGVLSLFKYHSQHGFVGLTTVPPFPYDDRYVQKRVREYRANLAKQEGFGPIFSQKIVSRTVKMLADVVPYIELEFDNGGKASTALIVEDGYVVQQWQFVNVEVQWEGSISLQRAAYTQLTEGGPLPDVDMQLSFEQSADGLALSDANLGSYAFVSGMPCESVSPSSAASTTPLSFRSKTVTRESVTLCFFIEESGEALALSRAAGMRNLQAAEQVSRYPFEHLLSRKISLWEGYWEGVPKDALLRRGLSYARMMAVPTSKNRESSCIMTDHMLLPLSWSRDAYYVARALLDWGSQHWHIVKEHLIWTFEVADRGEKNEWGRCYLLNGTLKDSAYQLDQQFFPLLELAEYFLETGDRETLERLSAHVEPVIDSVFSRKDPDAYLFPTEETPGDDPLDYAYHFSSHVLIWRTLDQLHRIFPKRDYDALAKKVKLDTVRHFVSEHNGKRMFAYATDAKGSYLFYHDANDVPLALAPEWDFCAADDEVWLATFEFAYSSENSDGYFGEMRLGSVHTPAPWPLGDVQLIHFARLKGDTKLAKVAQEHLNKAAQWDGALPEAYNGDSYEVQSRTWFAWPSAYYAMAMLNG